METSPPSPGKPSGVAGFALNQADIDEFKGIVQLECGVRLSDHDAWNRVIELLNLYRALLGPTPDDPEAPDAVRTSSPLPSMPGESRVAVQ